MTTTIKVKSSKSDKNPTEFTFNFGANLKEASMRFDGDSNLSEDQIVFGCYLVTAKLRVIDYIKKQTKKYKAGKKMTNDEIRIQVQKDLESWKPGPARKAKGKVAKTMAILGELSEEEKRVLFEKMGIPFTPRVIQGSEGADTVAVVVEEGNSNTAGAGAGAGAQHSRRGNRGSQQPGTPE